MHTLAHNAETPQSEQKIQPQNLQEKKIKLKEEKIKLQQEQLKLLQDMKKDVEYLKYNGTGFFGLIFASFLGVIIARNV
jgi:hypothetical protein